MASQEQAGTDPATLNFGAWLRMLREQKGLPQRAVAAAAQMDSSHYGKVELGKRLLTDAQLGAVAKILEQPEAGVRSRMVAAQWMQLCQGDRLLLSNVVGLVQESAAAARVNKPVINPVKRPGTKR